jgi:predicted Zn finger-like uncharacterized protein
MQITHCPTCATSFKVTPDQLRLANGWVRCGRCTGVFEALLHLTPPAELNETASLAAMLAELDLPLPSALPVAESTTAPLDVVPATSPASSRRGLWILASVSLLLLLIAQAAWMGRHVLFAQIPALRPALLAVCAPFQCEVTWPRALDAVLIENSSFSEASGGGYAVQLRLKNTENYPVATPALELSLLDLQDQVVVRRVFTQDELGLDDHLLALREVRAQVHFDLEAAASQRITGFRALVFYP